MCELGVAESDTTERLNTNHVRGSALLRLSKRGGPRMWSFAKPLGFCVCVLFFNVFLKSKDNWFTEFCCFLPNININQPSVCICPFPALGFVKGHLSPALN